MAHLLFYLIGFVAVVTALVTILHKKPAASVFFLVINFCAVAFIFLLLKSPFIAVLQVIVYAGAIMVLFLFVVMLLELEEEGMGWLSGRIRRVFVGILLVAFVAIAVYGMSHFPYGEAKQGVFSADLLEKVGNAEAVATDLFTKYLIPFEAASVLLLAALVGVIVFTKKEF